MGTSSHLSEPRSSRSYRKRMLRTVALTRRRWLSHPALCSAAAAGSVSERPLQTCLRTYIFHGAIITANTQFCFLVFHLTLSHNFFPLVYTDSAITFAEAVSPRLINSRRWCWTIYCHHVFIILADTGGNILRLQRHSGVRD